MKILIVEDDLEISKLLADFLQGNGYEVLCQYDGLHVLDCIQEHQIDLILLDIMLPYRSGDTILADIRKFSTVPVIVISRVELKVRPVYCIESFSALTLDFSLIPVILSVTYSMETTSICT